MIGQSTIIKGAIRSGAADESDMTWKAWLVASKKVVAYQRHHLGRNAANRGSAPAPLAGVLDLATRFVVDDGSATSMHSVDFVGDEVVAKPRDVSSATGLEGERENWRLVANLIKSLGDLAAAVVGVAGVPTVVMLCCVLLVFAQQRAIGKLNSQVEDLMAAVSELCDRHQG